MRAGCRPVLFFSLLVLWPAPLAAAPPVVAPPVVVELAGPARVVDGDSLVIAGQRIRLHGIDAPERAQTCRTASGRPWPCGAAARQALAAQIAGRAVTCRGTKRDRYGRLIALCFLSGRNLSAWMVARGWALAYRRYSHAYAGLEHTARTRGLWSGPFTAPWDWRRGQGERAAMRLPPPPRPASPR